MVHTVTVKIMNLLICPDVAANVFYPTLMAPLEILSKIAFPMLDIYMCT